MSRTPPNQNRHIVRTESRLAEYRDRFEFGPVASVILDRGGTIRDINQAGRRLLGKERTRLLKHRLGPFVSPGERDGFRDFLANAFEGGPRGNCELTLLPEGSQQPVCVRLVGNLSADGREFHAVLLDVSAQRQAEALLTCQTEILEHIATGTPLQDTLDALLRRMEEHNPGALCSLLLLDEDGVHVRHGAAPTLPAAFNHAVDGQPIGPAAGSCGTAAFRKEPVIVEDIATDPLWENYRAVALRHGLRACSSTPILDEAGRVLGTFAIYYREPGRPAPEHLHCIRLVTHLAAIAISRHRQDAALRRSGERLSAAFRASPVGICLTTWKEGRFLEANAAFLSMLGFARKEVIGRTVAEIRLYVEPGDRDDLLKQLQQDGVVRNHPMRFRRKSGELGDSLRSLEKVELDGQTVILTYFEDVTVRKQTEAALRQSEERLRLVTDGLGPEMFVGLLSTAGKVLMANRPALEAAGLRMEDVLGQPVHETYWFTYSDAVAGRFHAAVRRAAQGETVRYDERIRVGEGRLIWVAFTVNPLRDDSGKIVFLVPSAAVIEERKQAEEALRESESRYRTLFREMLSAFARCEVIVDSQGRPIDCRYLEVNPAYERTTGLSAKDLVGKRLFEVFPSLDPDWIAILGRVALTGQPAHVEKAVNSLGIWVDLMAFCPAPNQFACTFTDITGRKQSELALRESEARLRLSVEAANVGLWDWDLRTNKVFYSHEWKGQIGYRDDEISNDFNEWQSRVHPDDLEPTLAKVRRFAENPAGRYEVEFRFRHKDGSYRWIYAHGNVLRDAAGKPARMLGCHIDVTKRVQAEVALQQSEAQLRVFAGRIATATESERVRLAREIHDVLAQELTRLKMDAVWLARRLCEVPDPAQFPALAGRTADIIAAADMAITSVQKIATELRPTVLDTLGLAAAIEWQAGEFQRRAGISCRVQLDESIEPDGTHAIGLFRILQECLTNITRHAHARHVHIALRREAGEIIFTVTDDGRGIAPEELTAASSIGLTGMRERAILLGGRLEITGASGTGATIAVRIPEAALSEST